MAYVAAVPADMANLVPSFLARRARELLQLERALAKSDFDAIRTIGDNLYALGAPYGFRRLTAIGKLMREACDRSDGGLVHLLLNELREYLQRVKIREVGVPALPKWQSARSPSGRSESKEALCGKTQTKGV